MPVIGPGGDRFDFRLMFGCARLYPVARACILSRAVKNGNARVAMMSQVIGLSLTLISAKMPGKLGYITLT